MNEILIAGLVAVAIGLVETVKAAMKKFGSNNKSILTYDERSMLKDLHEWHNKEDADGVKVWYIRQSLADAITVFSNNVEAQTRCLEAISSKLSKVEHKIDALERQQDG
jgi:hypothetical protein